MITTYEVLKSIHILAAVVWLGGAIMVMLIAMRVWRAREPESLVSLFRSISFIAPRTFVPASLILVITGFWIVEEAGFSYDTWVIIAISTDNRIKVPGNDSSTSARGRLRR